MGAIKVHGYLASMPVMRVLACLHEKGLDYEFVQVNMMAGEHKNEPFLKLNPFGKIPVFQDGDLTLFESRAITRYIAAEYAENGTQLIQESPKAMAILNVGLEVEAHQFDPPASKLVRELKFKKLYGNNVPTDLTAVEEYEDQLSKVLDIYEARLSETKYLAGNEFSLVDIHHLPAMHYHMSTKVNELFESRPCVSAWRSSIMARPSWVKVIEMLNQARP